MNFFVFQGCFVVIVFSLEINNILRILNLQYSKNFIYYADFRNIFAESTPHICRHIHMG